jgi:Periplasmic binding protein domain
MAYWGVVLAHWLDVGDRRDSVERYLACNDEINAAGGVNGRELVPVVYDPGSEALAFGHFAKRLMVEDNVSTIFGCYTSSSRKAVLPVVERLNGLLRYPTPCSAYSLRAVQHQVPREKLLRLRRSCRFPKQVTWQLLSGWLYAPADAGSLSAGTAFLIRFVFREAPPNHGQEARDRWHA